MAVIKAKCSSCEARLNLTQNDLKIRYCSDTFVMEYLFICPMCKRATLRKLQPKVSDLLIAAGVEIETWNLPEELSEPKSGEPIQLEDVETFHDKIDDEEIFLEELSRLK